MIDWWRNRRSRALRDNEALAVPPNRQSIAASLMAPTRTETPAPLPRPVPVPQPRAFDVPRYVSRAPSPLVLPPVDQRVRIPIQTLQIGTFHAKEVRGVLDPTRRLLVYDIEGADFRIDVATNAIVSISSLSSFSEGEGEQTILELELSWPPRLRGDVDITRSQASLCLRHRLVFSDHAAGANALRQLVASTTVAAPPLRPPQAITRPPARLSTRQPESFIRGGNDASGGSTASRQA